MEVKTYYLVIKFDRVEKQCPFSILVVKFFCSPRSRERFVRKILSHYSRFYDVDSYIVSPNDFFSDIDLFNYLIH
ncbi:hypothetical protein [Parabacteroides distasonis]|uniref:hypothetical protein n=1 Tax=Parabacteroides distasonis TaxID=823 RepID=UPI0018A995E8|nr:hypothetical protein [Parabacteroides distasonis]MDB9024779.1 hypothetical protein [Parabacteroides distasonis]MDB9041304.1 hypothetical protein [Parabacteroides distasonis]MDB9093571.1 hypothetical protein [Parabacteroides distasonis]MDB9162774.1 hypothetical protein [Parabacteroides distasonis]